MLIRIADVIYRLSEALEGIANTCIGVHNRRAIRRERRDNGEEAAL